MNIIEKAYCRTYQAAFKAAIPLMPYREPKILTNVSKIGPLLEAKKIKSVLLVTDKGIRNAGLTAKLEEKLRKNRLTLQDYYEQLQQLRNMGDLSQIASMMPGALGRQMAGATIDDKALAHTEAIILSMTPEERENPQILGASRKKRIAAGCGLDVVDVNRLLKQFEGMQQIIKQVTGGRKPGFGFGGLGHGRGLRKRKKK